MEAKELRIGNLLSFEGKEMRVSSIHSDNTIRFKVPNGGSIGCFSLNHSDIEPIPLTEDWLIKFGWGKDEYDCTYIDNTSLKQSVLYYDVKNKMFLMESNSDTIEFNHIHYLHQFQNLIFALTGEELLIIKSE